MKIKADNSNRTKYNFKPSGIGDSWLIGTDADSDWANAFKNGVSDCPYNFIIPSSLTDEYGQTKKVEIIGQWAFFACADSSSKGQTRYLTLTRQVKVIKYAGLGGMYDLIKFEIEDGSVLETIETHGLGWIGSNTGYTEFWRVTLTLPSTLSTVFIEGIYRCNLFDVIIYCGSNPLSNTSILADASKKTVVKVTSEYPSDQKIFGRTPDRNSQAEVEESCKNFTYGFRTEPLESESESDVMVTGWGSNYDLWCPPKLEIPEVINGNTVVSIKANAFENCTTEGPISLPSTLKRVGASAFANTSFVSAIIINSSKLELGEAAFKGCGKNSTQPLRVSLPQNTQINGNAFEEANLGEVYIK